MDLNIDFKRANLGTTPYIKVLVTLEGGKTVEEGLDFNWASVVKMPEKVESITVESQGYALKMKNASGYAMMKEGFMLADGRKSLRLFVGSYDEQGNSLRGYWVNEAALLEEASISLERFMQATIDMIVKR